MEIIFSRFRKVVKENLKFFLLKTNKVTIFHLQLQLLQLLQCQDMMFNYYYSTIDQTKKIINPIPIKKNVDKTEHE